MGELSLVKTLDKFRIMPLILLAAAAEIAAASYGIIITITIALVILAILEHYRDDILDFISSIGNGITQMATIVWEWATLRSIKVTIPPPAVDRPWPIPKERTIPKDEPIPKDVSKPIAISTTKVKSKTRRREKDIYNVYDVHVNVPGTYREYTRGQGFINTYLIMGNIYKYGLTSLESVKLRYLIISDRYNLEKEQYILRNLNSLAFLPKEWYLHNVNYAKAHDKEVQLIDSYAIKHGKYPPGNTFRG